tara:strand:+ start:1378 stop:1509 length:132 start_codon:yes stop_codon:yes gene_type:complete
MRVRRELDIASAVSQFERNGESPQPMIENVRGFDHPVVTNSAG